MERKISEKPEISASFHGSLTKGLEQIATRLAVMSLCAARSNIASSITIAHYREELGISKG